MARFIENLISSVSNQQTGAQGVRELQKEFSLEESHFRAEINHTSN